MAARFGAEFLDVSLDDLDACDSLAWIVSTMEAPNGNASSVANCRAFAAAAEWGVRRVFSGLGSDELFCGHTKHLLAPWWPRLARLPRPLRSLTSGFLNRFGHPNLARALAEKGASSDMHRAMYTFLSNKESEWLRGGLARFAQPTPLNWNEPADAGFPSAYSSEILQVDLNVWLRSSLTPMAGTLAAANGIEIFLPFCSPEMVRLSASMPLSWKVKGRQGKRVLLRAIDDLVPAEILHRPRQGFTVPMDEWLRDNLSELAEALLSPSRVENWCLLHPNGLQRMFSEHISGNRDWGLPLWAWMTFSVWHEQFIQDAHANERMGRLNE
jgi:asparagine synthase (glutamine-hydrolysing)